jgi:fumarate reductase flavoprotein subunit
MSEQSAPSGNVDVVVVGAGLAGVAAALTAAEAGATVCLLEKGADFGGSSVRAGGGLLFAATGLQASLGVEDDREQLREAIVKYGHGKNDPALVDVYIRHQLGTYEWMVGHGVEFDLPPTGTTETSRMHATPQGYLTRLLHGKYTALPNTEFRVNAPAKRLVTDADRNVTGLTADFRSGEITISARRAVVLTTGGFARSGELLETFAPRWVDAVKMRGTENTGDGLRMAWALGAAVADMGYVEASFGASIRKYPDLTEDPAEEPRLLYPNSQGAIIVNLDGRRSTDESLNYKVISGICAEQPKSIGLMIFDEKIMSRSEPRPGKLEAGVRAGTGLPRRHGRGTARSCGSTRPRCRPPSTPTTATPTRGADPDFGRTIDDYGSSGGGAHRYRAVLWLPLPQRAHDHLLRADG